MGRILTMCAIVTCVGCNYQRRAPTPFNPRKEYVRITGMQVPESATIVWANRTSGAGASEIMASGPGVADGGTEIMLKLDSKTISGVVGGKPPFGSSWQHSDLPDVLLRRVELLKSWSKKTVYFSVRERCCGASDPNFPYWNGDVIVVDPDTGQVIVASWDM